MSISVPAEMPSILNESTDGLTLLDGDPSTIQCQSTHTRPAATISWKIGSSVLSDTDTREVSEAGGLVSVISTVSLVAQQIFHNTVIICQSKLSGQTGTPETRKLLKVWCKYVQTKALAHLRQRLISEEIIYQWLWHQNPYLLFYYSKAYQHDHVTGWVVLIWTNEILQITMVFNDDLHGDSEII